MANKFRARPNLSNEQFRQISGTTLTLEGATEIVGILRLQGIEVDATITGATSLYDGYTLTYDDSLGKIILKPAGAGDAINGSIFVTDIEPQSGVDNVGEKVFSSAGVVLDSCLSDTDDIDVLIIALPGHTNWRPNFTINGLTGFTLTESSTQNGYFTGTFPINISGTTEVVVVHEDGASHTVIVNKDEKPEIVSAEFTGGYPGTQTELKEGDTFDFFISDFVSDQDIVAVQFDNYGAYKAQTFSGGGINVVGTTIEIDGVEIADRGTTTQDLGARVRIQKQSGAWSDWYLTENDGSVDGENLVKLNNTYPTINITTIEYPTGGTYNQTALKGSEQAFVTNTVSNQGAAPTYSYTSPNSQLSFANPTTYESPKQVTRIGGDYNVSASNFRLTVVRTENGAESVGNRVVNIADAAPVIEINLPAARLRSGGNDGTVTQSHTITMTSTQRLLQAPTLADPASGFGEWQTSGTFTWNATATSFTNTLLVDDEDNKGNSNFSGLFAVNMAGIEVTTISSGANYELGGFVSRTINIPGFQAFVDFNVETRDYSKLTQTWDFKTLNVKEAVGTTAPPPVDSGWALRALNEKPSRINILDTEAANASSDTSQFTIEEAV